MACPDKIPSYSDFLALQNKVAQLESKLSKKPDENWVKDFIVSWVLGEGLSKITGGILRSGAFSAAITNTVAPAVNTAIASSVSGGSIASALAGVKASLGGQIARVDSLLNSTAQKAGRVDDLANGFFDIRKRVDSVQGAVNTTARRVNDATKTANSALSTARSASSKAAQAASTAAAAGATASSALGKITAFLTAIGVIGGVAGLISLFGFFKATRPQFAANEKRLDSQAQAISDNLSLITQNRNIAKRAQATANEAKQDAAAANDLAKIARRDASQAKSAAAAAQTTANAADSRARANTSEIERLKREGLPMDQGQYTTLKKQNDSAIGQNSRIIKLIERIPTNPNGDLKIPPELLMLPPAMRRVERTTSDIAKNTTPSAQKRFSKDGTCQAFAPRQCGDKALARNLSPIKRSISSLLDRLNKINGILSGAILGNTQRAISKLDALTGALNEKFNKTWEYLKLDRVLNLISTAASIHNAAMLSRNVLGSLVDSFSGILSIVGLRDAEGNPYDLGSQISDGIESLIISMIGAEAAQGISEQWNKWNRIISAGAAVVMAVRSVQWALAEGIEIIGNWVAQIGNGLREGGAVNDRQWPWMKEGIKIKQFSRVEKFNEGLESAENITNQIYATVAAGVEIGQTVNEVRNAKSNFDSTLATETTEADQDFDQRNAESEAPEIENIDLVKIEVTE